MDLRKLYFSTISSRWNPPFIIHRDGSMIYLKNGRKHRENDLPAVIHTSGRREWWYNGLLHRDRGPAVVWGCGMKEYFSHGFPNRSPVSRNRERPKEIRLEKLRKRQQLQRKQLQQLQQKSLEQATTKTACIIL